MQHHHHARQAAALIASLLIASLAACGGGGGGSGTAGTSASASTSSAAGSSASAGSSAASTSSTGNSSSVSSASSVAGSSAASSATSSLAAAAFNVDGYAAAASVTGGGVLAETDAQYIKVTTPAQFLAALNNIKSSNSKPYKVIEIAADLDLGYTEAGGATTEATYSFFTSNAAPKLHPTLITTGVSKITIQAYDGLTIYSKSGNTLRHAEFNIKNGKNLILRNLKFDELWEWDESSKGNYDDQDWDYITIGDTSSASGRVWIDHCTFYKSYDGIVDIKKGAGTAGAGQAANGVTISWSEILPGSGNSSFMKAQFDYLETNKSSMTMYNYLRGFMSQAQIMEVASSVKKGHLIGATSLGEPTGYTVTLHHNYYKDLQDRMPRLRSGDVQVFNLYADASAARITKKWFDELVAANPTLTTKLTDSGPTYHFGVTSNGSISTEGGAVEVTNSFYKGVLTPLRNNQTDVTNSSYTGAIVATGTRMEVLSGTDSSYLASPQGTYTDSLGSWMYWQGNSTDSGSPLAATQATAITFAWHNGTPPTPKRLDAAVDVPALVTGNAGAGKVSLTAAQWMNANN